MVKFVLMVDSCDQMKLQTESVWRARPPERVLMRDWQSNSLTFFLAYLLGRILAHLLLLPPPLLSVLFYRPVFWKLLEV